VNKGQAAHYVDLDVNGGVIKVCHTSSPDVVWDGDLVVTAVNGKVYKGAFRIYFHAMGWTTVIAPDGTETVKQRTFMAISHNGIDIDEWTNTTLDDPTIAQSDDVSAIDAITSDYARIIKNGMDWFALYNAEPAYGASYNIALSRSLDNGYKFEHAERWFIKGDAFNGETKAGIPCYIMRENCLYVAYTARDQNINTSTTGTFGDGIYLVQVLSNGEIVKLGQILTENTGSPSSAWDSYRIAAPFLLEWDDGIYLFYSGTSKSDAQINGNRWEHSHIGVVKGV
jgi:hypothetical protein